MSAEEQVARIRKLHSVETVMTVRPGCGEDGACSHEEKCPEDNPFQVCGHCREQAESVYYYWEENTGAWEAIRWPCLTIQALDGAS